MKEIHRTEAERLLGVSDSTVYNWANKLGISFISRTNAQGKTSFLRWEDLETMAKAMGKSLQQPQAEESQPFATADTATASQPNSADTQEWVTEKVQLELQLAKQEETIKGNDQVIQTFQQQNQYLQTQVQTEQHQKSNLFQELVKAKTQATAFLVASIAL